MAKHSSFLGENNSNYRLLGRVIRFVGTVYECKNSVWENFVICLTVCAENKKSHSLKPCHKDNCQRGFLLTREKSNLLLKWKQCLVRIFLRYCCFHQFLSLLRFTDFLMWYRDVSQTMNSISLYSFSGFTIEISCFLQIQSHTPSSRKISSSLSQSLNQLVTWSTDCSNSIDVNFSCVQVAYGTKHGFQFMSA